MCVYGVPCVACVCRVLGVHSILCVWCVYGVLCVSCVCGVFCDLGVHSVLCAVADLEGGFQICGQKPTAPLKAAAM